MRAFQKAETAHAKRNTSKTKKLWEVEGKIEELEAKIVALKEEKETIRKLEVKISVVLRDIDP